MPRRSGRQSSSSSLHISSNIMSTISDGPESGTEEPKVVVQTLPEVEPSEERLTPGPPATSSGQLTTAVDDTGAEIEVRTRLRPNRSSWKTKYSPEEPKKVIFQKLSPGPEPIGKINGPVSPVKKAVELKEDTVQKNLKQISKRERTPSTDSATESAPTQKKRGKVLATNVATTPTITVKTESQLIAATSKVSNKPILVVKSPNVKTPQQNGKILQVEQEILEPTLVEVIPDKIPSTPTTTTSSGASDGPGFCEICGGEYAFLELHKRTHHTDDAHQFTVPKPKKVPQRRVYATIGGESLEGAVEISRAYYESLLIESTVKQDNLIQEFGVRLLGMSTYPEQKVHAVSQRMIELVRLLKAAQGYDPNIQNLSQLLHNDHWPTIIDAIMYVAGYQDSNSTFRNPVFVFDIGQALKFAAYILKSDAIETCNISLEQSLKDFMNSIDGKIDSILPGVSGFKSVHFLDGQGVEITDDTKTEVVRTEVITVEDEQQVQDMLNDINSASQAGQEFILPGYTTVDANYVTQEEFAPCDITLVPEEGGEEQATLLLEFSQAQTSSVDTSVVSQVSSPQLNLELDSSPTVQTTTTTTANDAFKLFNKPVILPSSSTTASSPTKKLVVPNSNVTYVKIINASTNQGQKKLCLIIPSQSLKNQQKEAKTTAVPVTLMSGEGESSQVCEFQLLQNS